MAQDLSPPKAEAVTESSSRGRIIEQETERLQAQVAALKRLQKLKQEEEELKRWLSGDRDGDDDQSNSSLMCDDESSYPSPSRSRSGGGLKQRGPLTAAPTSGNTWGRPLTAAPKFIGGFAKDKYDKMKNRFSSAEGRSKKDDDDWSGGRGDDVERQSHGKRTSIKTKTTRKLGGKQQGTPNSGNNSAGSIPVKVLLRKIAMAVLTDLDDETLQREDTETILIVITLLKEAMLGILIAFVAVSFVLFIDHRFLLHLPTARNFRRATFAVMNDRETLRNVEENAGLKFMEMDEFNSMVSEIEKAANKTELAESILKTRSSDLIDMEQERLGIERDHKQELSSLGLDKFCGKCKWRGGMTCQGRVDALIERHRTPKFQAMMSAMQNGCREYTGQEIEAMQQQHQQRQRQPPVVQKQQQQQQQQVDKMTLFKYLVYQKDDQEQNNNNNVIRGPNNRARVADANSIESKAATNLDDFCGGCEWKDGMTCGKQTYYLNENFGTPIVDAMELVMAQQPKCTNAYYDDSINNFGGFCGECVWGHKKSQTCQARVEYLMYTYSKPLREAQLAAMEKPVCRRGQHQFSDFVN